MTQTKKIEKQYKRQENLTGTYSGDQLPVVLDVEATLDLLIDAYNEKIEEDRPEISAEMTYSLKAELEEWGEMYSDDVISEQIGLCLGVENSKHQIGRYVRSLLLKSTLSEQTRILKGVEGLTSYAFTEDPDKNAQYYEKNSVIKIIKN